MTEAAPRRSTMHRIRLLLWGLVAIAAIGMAALLLRPAGPAEPGGTPALTGFTLGGPFTLTDAQGQSFPSSKLAGKPYVMFFGFTHCPDVCPTTLARLAKLREQVGTGPDALRIVFVSVDPGRDTPAALRAYAALFDTPVVMLTGSPEQVERVKKSHGIYSAKVAEPSAADGYTVDHSAAAFLFDKGGTFVSTIAPDEPDSAALAKLKRVVA
jgi:protein SCO1/2